MSHQAVFYQIYTPKIMSFWQKDSLITHISTNSYFLNYAYCDVYYLAYC